MSSFQNGNNEADLHLNPTHHRFSNQYRFEGRLPTRARSSFIMSILAVRMASSRAAMANLTIRPISQSNGVHKSYSSSASLGQKEGYSDLSIFRRFVNHSTRSYISPHSVTPDCCNTSFQNSVSTSTLTSPH